MRFTKWVTVLFTVLFFVLGLRNSAFADTWKTTGPCQPVVCTSEKVTTACSLTCLPTSGSFCVGKPPCTLYTRCGAVCLSGGSGGTVNVTSENSQIASDAVTSTWNFAGSVADPCAGSLAQCTGTSASYTGLPSGSGVDIYTLNVPAVVAGYSIRSIRNHVAQIPSEHKNPIVAFLENFIGTAHAYVICGFLNSNASSCPAPMNSLALSNANDTANFLILWDPIAAMDPITSPITLSSSVPAKTISIVNAGSPGSTLTWTAGVPVYAGSGGWLTVSPSNGSALVGTPGTVTFTADPSAVPKGSYSATVTFSGSSAPGIPPSAIPTQTVTVNFTNGSSGSGVSIISVSPSSTVPVGTPVTTVCAGGSGSYTWTASGPAIFSSDTGKNFTFSYSVPSAPTYTVTCIDANNPGSTASVQITVTQVTPVCAFNANPTQIVVPGSSTLSWTCRQAVSCDINGTSVNPVSGMMSVSPTANTTYSLTCQGPGTGAGSSVTVQAQVNVVGPGVIEGNPT